MSLPSPLRDSLNRGLPSLPEPLSSSSSGRVRRRRKYPDLDAIEVRFRGNWARKRRRRILGRPTMRDGTHLYGVATEMGGGYP